MASESYFDVVIDIPGTAKQVYNAFGGKTRHIIACGSLWMYGFPHILPTPELRQGHCPFEGYKNRFDDINSLLKISDGSETAFTAIMPPNICGPGKIPLDTLGGRDIEVHISNKKGTKVFLPEGADSLIGPCDAEDIAEVFALAVENRTAAAGEIFNVGAAYSITASKFVEAYADIYGVDIPIERIPWSQYTEFISPGIGHWWHFYAHMQPDISKTQKKLGYLPKYTPYQTLERAVEWMVNNSLI